MEIIRKPLTLEYWTVNEWFEGRLREMPAVLSQGETLDDLKQHVREDCIAALGDPDFVRRKGYLHLDESDFYSADIERVPLGRHEAAVAQLEALSPDRQEKVFIYIEDLIDLETLERRVEADEARRREEESGGEEEW
ncbi:MAG: hypothetical protein QM796_07875 [Chthoniobacteraceae bacterium]